MTGPIMCVCGHEGIDHDGVGCTDCGCSQTADQVLGPPEAAELPSYTVDELDMLHQRVGLGDLWEQSDARADALAKQAAAIPLEWCDACGAYADRSHTHGE